MIILCCDGLQPHLILARALVNCIPSYPVVAVVICLFLSSWAGVGTVLKKVYQREAKAQKGWQKGTLGKFDFDLSSLIQHTATH